MNGTKFQMISKSTRKHLNNEKTEIVVSFFLGERVQDLPLEGASINYMLTSKAEGGQPNVNYTTYAYVVNLSTKGGGSKILKILSTQFMNAPFRKEQCHKRKQPKALQFPWGVKNRAKSFTYIVIFLFGTIFDGQNIYNSFFYQIYHCDIKI